MGGKKRTLFAHVENFCIRHSELLDGEFLLHRWKRPKIGRWIRGSESKAQLTLLQLTHSCGFNDECGTKDT